MNEFPIQFLEVSRRFGRDIVLDRLDLAVRAGEIYALIGRNGAGKTTALRLLLGLIEPHEGELRIFGRRPSCSTAPDLRRIGYLGEGHRLPAYMNARRLMAIEAAVSSTFDVEGARRALVAAGIPERRPVHFLSRGQRAQLALVLVLATRPDVLILDDPALGLDSVRRRQLLDFMIGFLAERGESGASVLWTSHDIRDVERVADRVGFLSGGRIVVEGAPGDLVQQVTRRRVRRGRVLPDDARILRRRSRGEVDEVLIRDEDAALVAALAESKCGEPSDRLDLEEIFISLLGDADTTVVDANLELAS